MGDMLHIWRNLFGDVKPDSADNDAAICESVRRFFIIPAPPDYRPTGLVGRACDIYILRPMAIGIVRR